MSRSALWLSTAFWLMMMLLLFMADVLPNYTAVDNPGYDTVVGKIEAPVTRVMAVMQGDEEVGLSTTNITPQPDGTYSISNVTDLQVKVGILEYKFSAVLNVTLDADKQLDQVFLDVNLGADRRARVKGRRINDRLILEIDFAGNTFRENLPYDNTIISSYFNPFPIGARLKVGQEWRIKLLDPLFGSTKVAVIKVVAKETIKLAVRKGEEPREFSTYKIVTEWNSMTLNAWATEEGVVLKEETPLGYTLVYRESDEND